MRLQRIFLAYVPVLHKEAKSFRDAGRLEKNNC